MIVWTQSPHVNKFTIPLNTHTQNSKQLQIPENLIHQIIVLLHRKCFPKSHATSSPEKSNLKNLKTQKKKINEKWNITWAEVEWQSGPSPLDEDNSYKTLPSHPIAALSFPTLPHPLSILSNMKKILLKRKSSFVVLNLLKN